MMPSGIVEALLSAIVGGSVGAVGIYCVQERKLQKEHRLNDSAECVVHDLLSHTNWRLRSFKVTKHHLGGFEDNELRKLLVCAGSVRFMSKSGIELWGLIERNKDRLGVTRINADPANLDDDNIFK